jgi:hypothetical protein
MCAHGIVEQLRVVLSVTDMETQPSCGKEIVMDVSQYRLEHLRKDWGKIEGDNSKGEAVVDCGFVNGKCISQRQGHSPERGCCDRCAMNGGYFFNDVPKSANLIEMEFLFDDVDGFWVRDKGCSLPREWRSHVCRRYSCRAAGQYTLEQQKNTNGGGI